MLSDFWMTISSKIVRLIIVTEAVHWGEDDSENAQGSAQLLSGLMGSDGLANHPTDHDSGWNSLFEAVAAPLVRWKSLNILYSLDGDRINAPSLSFFVAFIYVVDSCFGKAMWLSQSK